MSLHHNQWHFQIVFSTSSYSSWSYVSSYRVTGRLFIWWSSMAQEERSDCWYRLGSTWIQQTQSVLKTPACFLFILLVAIKNYNICCRTGENVWGEIHYGMQIEQLVDSLLAISNNKAIHTLLLYMYSIVTNYCVSKSRYEAILIVTDMFKTILYRTQLSEVLLYLSAVFTLRT